MLGETPLPKHIGRTPTSMDNERFQTIYAEHEELFMRQLRECILVKLL